MIEEKPKVLMWLNRNVEDLSKAELIDALNWCAGEIERLRTDRGRWFAAGDAAKYLLNGNVK